MAVVCAGCGSSSGPGIVFDPCTELTITAPTATTDELAAIDAAIVMWQGHGVDSLVRIADVADLTVAFRAANPESFGYYDNTSATIYLNSVLPDDQLGIVVAHELGHAFALVHVFRPTCARRS